MLQRTSRQDDSDDACILSDDDDRHDRRCSCGNQWPPFLSLLQYCCLNAASSRVRSERCLCCRKYVCGRCRAACVRCQAVVCRECLDTDRTQCHLVEERRRMVAMTPGQLRNMFNEDMRDILARLHRSPQTLQRMDRDQLQRELTRVCHLDQRLFDRSEESFASTQRVVGFDRTVAGRTSSSDLPTPGHSGTNNYTNKVCLHRDDIRSKSVDSPAGLPEEHCRNAGTQTEVKQMSDDATSFDEIIMIDTATSIEQLFDDQLNRMDQHQQNIAMTTSTNEILRTSEEVKDTEKDIVQCDSSTDVLTNRIERDHLKKMSVADIRRILEQHSVDTNGCCERSELVDKLLQLWKDLKRHAGNEVPEAERCLICMDARVDCAFLECGHMVTCNECGRRIKDCPVCRMYVTRVVRTYRA